MQLKLDKIDMRLIYELDNNSRQNLNTLAKKLRISRNVANYRIERLKKEDIIKGTFTEINNVALGYYSFRMFINIGCCTKQKTKKLINYIYSQPNLIWLSEVIGRWNIDLVYITKDIFEFEDFRKELMLKFNSIIEKTHISLLTQIYHYPKDYLINKKRTNIQRKVFDPKKRVEIDEFDELILYLLSDNTTLSILKIAEKTGLSINTIKRRIKELEKNNVILGYRLLIDTNKLGYYYYKLHVNFKNYNQNKIKEFRAFLESKNYFIYTDHYISGEDFEIELHLKTENEYLKFLEEMFERFGPIIKEHFLIKFHKEYFFRYLPKK